MPPMPACAGGSSAGRLRALAYALVLCAAGAAALLPRSAAQSQSRFAAQIAALSETGGHFDTDNLISNEHSYLHVLPDLSAGRAAGGAYIGVGPDQNFTYIAALQPDVAYIVDIRRDNMLLHLLFKGIFAVANTRADYLAILTGRPILAAARHEPSIETIVGHIDGSRPRAEATAAIRSRVDAAIARTGVPLDAADRATIDRFHRRFISAGLDLRFQSAGRPPRAYYPTYRQLLLARDGSGEMRNFLASDRAFAFVKGLHAADAIIPVVGDVSGPRAVAAIAEDLTRRGERVAAFYISNVEFYLFRSDRYARFVENLRLLPRTTDGVLIRSVFNPYAYAGGGSGQGSVSRLEPISGLLDRFDRRRIRRYADLVGRE
jgi:hypothetical protein